MPYLWEVCQFLAALAIVVIAVEAITEILVTSALLDIVGVRGWATKRAIPNDPALLDEVRWHHVALHKLLTCGYCASVWVAAAVAWTLPGGWFGLLPWDNIVIKIFLVHRLANWMHVAEQLCGLVRRLAKKKHDHHVLQILGHGEQDDKITVKVEITDDAREILRGAGPPGGGEAGRQDLRVAEDPDAERHPAPGP